jgi:hypothetical protein
MKTLHIALVYPALMLSACGESRQDAREDRVEEAAEASAAAAGTAEAALGLTEAQLLDAELVGPGNVELGDVTSLVRGRDGKVEWLIIEVEDSDPDRFVQVPVQRLTVFTRGDETDLATTISAEELDALPDAELPVP